MKDNASNEQYQYIISLILKKRLKEALFELNEYLSDAPDWELAGELERTETAYGYMLSYMRQNAVDPERKKLHTKLLAKAWEIAEQARIEKNAVSSTRRYYSSRNRLKTMPLRTIKTQLMEMETYAEDTALAGLLKEDTLKDPAEIRARHEQAQEIMFLLIWTKAAWKSQHEAEAQEALHSLLIPARDLCLFVSAVTISLMECFDVRKIMWLFDAYEHRSPLVNQRALVGLALMFQLYHQRILLYPAILARLSLLGEDEQFGKGLSRVHIQMLRTQETEKIDKKMREEIIPEMMKNPNLRNLKFGFDESEEDSDDHNPDWAQDFENSPLGDKLKEMSELQMEGADVYMSTFSALKNYPFFKTISNWFYPFDPQHSSVVQELSDKKENSILDVILGSGLFCDSDKYSLCFTIMYMPQQQREAMISQLSEQQISDLKNEQSLASKDKFTEQPEIISNQYLHNLYRFFKLYPRRHEFRDVFKENFRLNEYDILRPILHKEEFLKSLAEYYFRKEFYAEAIKTYRSILEMEGVTAETYQKIGFCLQKEKKYSKAIEAYLKSDMIKPDNVWTIRHLATCYRLNRSFEKALEYYRKAEEMLPENKTIIFNIGNCLAELGRYDEALRYFYKLDFIDPNNVKNRRALAWCSFVDGKHSQAMNHYEKILAGEASPSDFMNAGHVAWSMKQMEKAIEYYSQSIEKLRDKAEFIDMFYKDKENLLRQGINEDDIPLMLDLLQ